MKKLLWLLTIALFATTTALAQGIARQKAPRDLQIIRYNFDPGYHTTRITHNGFKFPGINNIDIDGELLRYDGTIVVKNNGSRKIKAFTLGIVFVNLETRNEVEHRKAYYRKSVAPGAEKTVSRGVLQTNKPGPIIVKAVIDRIEYEDGSVWQP